jgi:type I restriction enzyme R subunit
VLVSLFNTRLRIVEATMLDPDAEPHRQAVADLRAMVSRIPLDSFPVQKVIADIEQAWQDDFWVLLTPAKVSFLRDLVGPLLRFAGGVDVAAETFTHKVERLKLGRLRQKPSPDLAQSIAEDVSRLPSYVAENPEARAAIETCLSQRLLESGTSELDRVITLLAPHMRNRRERPSGLLALDLPDYIATSGMVSVGIEGRQVLVEEYRQMVESRVLALVEEHPVLLAIRDGRPVAEDQLIELERLLNRELGQGELQLTGDAIRKAYGIRANSFLALLRHLLKVDAIPDYPAVVRQAFGRHITSHAYNADQIRFLRSVQAVFLQKHRLTAEDLYEPPFDAYGRNAVERYFTEQEIAELLELTERLVA